MYISPMPKADAYHCPYCGVYAHQTWWVASGHLVLGGGGRTFDDVVFSTCTHCGAAAIWRAERLLYPAESAAPLPSSDMPKDVMLDFNEARSVVSVSPRAAAALLRLAVDKLTIDLNADGKDLNERIGSMVRRGLPDKMQKALDSLRVIGNNAVHPGTMDLRDDTPTAISLFELLNFIVDVMITRPNRVDEIYAKIPEGSLKGIARRDGR